MQNVREFCKSFNKSQTTLFSRKPFFIIIS
jgi:hypothetical protein